MFNVEDIYKFCDDNDYFLLGQYMSDFWEYYRENHSYFDRLFMKSYRSFIPFNCQNDTILDTAADFINDVLAWLTANDKRYSELYRLQLLTDEEEPVTYNYDMTEKYSGTTSSTEGARSDTHAEQRAYGAKTTSETLGAHTDTHNNSNSYGATSGQTVQGSTVNSSEHKVSAYNSNTYAGKDSDNESLGSRTDSHSETQHSDTLNLTDTFAKRENSVSEAAHTDSISGNFGKGAQTNSGTEGHTLTRKGNIGTQTGADIAMKHQELWTNFNFYKLIFDEIANEFLRV